MSITKFKLKEQDFVVTPCGCVLLIQSVERCPTGLYCFVQHINPGNGESLSSMSIFEKNGENVCSRGVLRLATKEERFEFELMRLQ